jgi:hypothetical protein
MRIHVAEERERRGEQKGMQMEKQTEEGEAEDVIRRGRVRRLSRSWRRNRLKHS